MTQTCTERRTARYGAQHRHPSYGQAIELLTATLPLHAEQKVGFA